MSNGGHSRFIPSEEIDERKVVQWRFGDMDGLGGTQSLPGIPGAPGVPATPQAMGGFHNLSLSNHFDVPQLQADPRVVEAESPASEAAPAAPEWDEARLHELLEQARAEGHAQGLQEGQQQAQQQWQQHLDEYVSGAGRETARRVDALLSGLDGSLRQLQSDMAQELLNLACDIARQVVRQELRSQPQALLPVVREALDMLATEGRAATVRLNPADFTVLDEALRAEQGAHSKVQWISDATVAQGDVRVDSGGSQVDAGLDKRWRRAVAALGLVSTWYDGERDAG